MNKKLLLILLFCPMIFLAVWIFSVDMQSKNGVDIKVSITGYDPRDILSGHYILYQIDWEKTDCSQFADNVCHEETFCQGRKWTSRRICRFYIPESYAERLDDLFRHRNDDSLNFEVVYSYNPIRKAIAKQLLINGQDWKEMMKD